jgi:hypothetical protein
MGLLREGAIAACLTALMIVLFLGSWRSTLVVMISIPLAILKFAGRPVFPRRQCAAETQGKEGNTRQKTVS